MRMNESSAYFFKTSKTESKSFIVSKVMALHWYRWYLTHITWYGINTEICGIAHYYFADYRVFSLLVCVALVIPQPGNDKWHLPVKRAAVTRVNQYIEMDDTAGPDAKGFLLFRFLQACRLPPAVFFLTSPKCHPLHHCHPLITSPLLVLYLGCRNFSAECHHFECNINGINILTSCHPNAGNWSPRYSGKSSCGATWLTGNRIRVSELRASDIVPGPIWCMMKNGFEFVQLRRLFLQILQIQQSFNIKS